VCFRTSGVILCKSPDVMIVQDAGGGFNTGRKENEGVGRRKIQWRCKREEWIYIFKFLRFDSYPAFCWLMNTQWPSLHLAKLSSTSSMRSVETRFSNCSDDCLRRRALLWHHIPLVPLRPGASRSELSSSEVVPSVQPSNMATNT